MRCPTELYRDSNRPHPSAEVQIKLSLNGDTLGGQERQAELEKAKGIPDREPGGLGGLQITEKGRNPPARGAYG